MDIGERYALYHRISQMNGREAEDNVSEHAAREQADAWATLRGRRIVRHYIDRDQTGSKMARPQLDAMLADLEAGVIDGVFVPQVDRLSRADVGDALAVVKRILEIAPGRLVLNDLGIDPATEFGEFGLTVLLALARMQWRRFKRQWQTAQRHAVGRGVQIGPAPFGYRKRDGGQLEVDPKTGPLMAEAFRIAGRDGLHAALAYLGERAPERYWTTDALRTLFASRTYLGEIAHGELRNTDAHEPLATLADWTAAQSAPRSRRSNASYPLSGIAVCERCGGAMVGGIQSTPRGYRYRRYRCQAGCKGGTTINADKLEAEIRDALKSVLADERFRESFAPAGIVDAQRALERAEDERVRFANDLEMREILGDLAWREGARARKRAVDEAQARYERLAGHGAVAAVLPLAGQLDNAGQFERALGIVDRIVVAPGDRKRTIAGRITVEWRHAFEDVTGPLAA